MGLVYNEDRKSPWYSSAVGSISNYGTMEKELAMVSRLL
ncbi:hypothetical protein EGR_09281 [Echinococcus granulosus]|uniref:Uncharacterized protein n=1 Tax=Echinococcus granulosus TaxID=6210 RepID=W6U444_ECHGR|nr:hypothetical protein EGR_09281 [Echinococcus granulosus]EUB55878.1 hypothetical protein EGR_09281 [Echinococcus granulosus]